MKATLLSFLILLLSISSGGQCLLSPITGNGTVGLAQSTALADLTLGGTWSSSDTNIAMVDMATGLVFGRSSGNAIITYSLSGPCSGTFVTYPICVNAGFAGRTKLCLGDTTTLQNIPTGTWTSSNPSVAAINSTTGFVTAGVAGFSIITQSFSISGISYAAIDTVQVASITSIAAITGNHALCSGQNIVLRNSATPVLWSSGDLSLASIVLANADSVSIDTHGSGSLQIICASAYCLSIKDSVTVTINPTPSVGAMGPDTICIGATAIYTHDGDTGIFGYWSTFGEPYASCTIDSFTGVLTPIIWAYMDLVVYTSITPFGCSNSSFVSVYYKPPPYINAIAGDTSIHIGTAAQFSTWGWEEGVNRWRVSPTTIATISQSGNDSAIVSGLTLGTATISIVATNSCALDTNMYWNRAQTINVVPPEIGAVSTSFTSFINRSCSAPQFGVSVPAHAATYSFKTFYGDGHVDTTVIAASTASAITTFTHSYGTSGVYTIKQVLYNGSVALDSVTYSYQHLLCRDIALSFYVDGNNNCNYDTATESLNCFSLLVAIDSNGVPKDTISAAGGLYYQTFGNTGDIYSFRILGLDTSLHFSCSFAGVIYDTLGAGIGSGTNRLIGVQYPAGTSFDLSQNSTVRSGRGRAIGNILPYNLLSLPQLAIVKLNISPKYVFESSTPAPSSIVGNTVTWTFAALSASSALTNINYRLNTPSTWLMPGDTAHTTISVFPTTGDVNPANNIITRIDTVKSSFDPNHISVSPEGNILNGTRLHYGIEFENDGNDTAQNIYVMDTLSDNLNLSTFRIAGASHAVNIAMLHSGGHNIVKFEFPNIKLLDSTHHGKCSGVVFYTINAKTGLANGTEIVSHAGIYFDDNPVVLTDTAINTILIPQISVATTTGDTICAGAAVHLIANPASVNITHYQWAINSVNAGTDSIGFTIPAATVGDTIKCVMTTIMDDTIYSTSNSVRLINRGLPVAGSISGLSTVCAGADVSLSATVSAGSWSASGGNATIAAGVVHGVSAGSAVISYSVSNQCGTVVATHAMTVNPLPNAGTITGSPIVCEAAVTTLNNTTTGGSWSTSSSSATVAGGAVSGMTAGTSIISYSVSNSCGTAVDTMLVTVNPLPNAGTITGAPAVCESATTVLHNIATTGSWSSSSSSASVIGGTVSGISAGISVISYTVTNSCGTAIDTMLVTVNPLPQAGTITGSPIVCEAAVTTLSNATTGGSWSTSSPSVTIASGIVSGISAGTTIISYSVSNSCGTAIDTILVTVNPLPSAGTITGTPIVCESATTVLNNTATSGTWSSSSAVASIIGGTVSGISAGTSIISYTVINSCGTAIDTMLVTINPLPHAGTITSPSILCVTGSFTLSSTATGGVWSSSSPSALVTGSTVLGVSTGSSLISYAVTNSCGVATDTMTIDVYPMPSVGLITGENVVCTGATTVLNNSASGGVWSSSNTGVASISGGTVTGVSAGTALITYLLTNVCGSAMTSRSINVLSTADCNTGIAVDVVAPAEYKIYPNPNTGSFAFTGKTNALSNDVVHYDVIDITGKVVYSNSTQPQNGIINEQVDLTTIVSGQYMLRVVTGDSVETLRFVVVK